MTKIIIYKKSSNIYCVEANGHTGYADYGNDILCSAISSIIQSAVIGVTRVAKLKPKVKINASNGYLLLRLNPTEENKQGFTIAQYILQTMFLSLQDIAQNYRDFIELEVIEDDD